ncbi:TPA: DUF554 family protein [Klebsiella variicola subsp. variicola]|nr:DUF554 family protein [Klebsiella variicola subsp. variicola]
MITGPWINGSAVIIGGMAGAIISARLPDRLRVSMPLIFGAMHEGMTGDNSVLIAKAFLDLLTALIFATTLGYAVALVAVPQLIIQLALAWNAVFILPMTTPAMQADFSAVGGVLMVATGLRIAGIKVFPVAGMLPSLVLAMPVSCFWTTYF